MRLLAPALFLLFCGTAQAALFADNDAREEIIKLRKYVKEDQGKRIQDLQARLTASEQSRQALEKRLAEMEAAEQARSVDLLAQIDQLHEEISKLRGQLEVNSHQIGLSQQRQRDLYTDLDGRLRKLESGATSQAPSAGAATPDDNGAELKDYEAAHEMFKAAKYKEAAEAFEQFLTSHPSGKYTPNAHYWLGYAQFSQKDYKSAIASQEKLLQLYPDNPKVPDAMYNIANCQIQLSDLESAKKTLRTLIEKYPSSDTAPLAKKRLAVLESVKSKK